MGDSLTYYSPDDRWWLRQHAVLSPEQQELNNGAYRIYLARQYARQRDALTAGDEWAIPLALLADDRPDSAAASTRTDI
jgi:hypothetical protein